MSLNRLFNFFLFRDFFRYVIPSSYIGGTIFNWSSMLFLCPFFSRILLCTWLYILFTACPQNDRKLLMDAGRKPIVVRLLNHQPCPSRVGPPSFRCRGCYMRSNGRTKDTLYFWVDDYKHPACLLYSNQVATLLVQMSWKGRLGIWCWVNKK